MEYCLFKENSDTEYGVVNVENATQPKKEQPTFSESKFIGERKPPWISASMPCQTTGRGCVSWNYYLKGGTP